MRTYQGERTPRAVTLTWSKPVLRQIAYTVSLRPRDATLKPMKASAVFLLLSCSAFAEVRTMTLKQALDLALNQSPEVVMARLDRQKARDQVTIARDPFVPKVFAGSGAAWTYGFPGSIDGNAPSIFQAKTVMSIFDRPQSYQIAQANENARAADVAIGLQQDEVAYRITNLYLDAEQASRSLAAVQRQLDNLVRVKELMDVRISEGRELPIETKKANLAVLRARLRADGLSAELVNAETSLSLALGYGPDDRVRAVQEAQTFEPPVSEEGSIEKALEENRELKRLESNLQAKTLEIKGWQSQRLPKINLIAQYALFGKYNNFQDYFQKFSRNNIQLGASFEVPVLTGRSHSAYAAQAEAEAAKLRVEVSRTRGRITADIRRSYQEVRRADNAREVARADLDLAREQLSIDLAQYDEGRTPLARVEASRAEENEKWLAYYDAQHTAETARVNVLRQTGTLIAAIK
jgi:outer membrane protein